MAKFVIVIDAQVDFMRPEGALYVAGAEALIAPMQAWLVALHREDTAGILFTFDTHEADRYAASAEAAEFPLHCVRGSPGWQSVLDVAAIDPGVPIYRLEKGVFAMWAEPDVMIADAEGGATPRDLFFDALRAGSIDEVWVIGVAADYCVRWAVDGLLAHGFAVTVPAALTHGIARQIDEVAAAEWPDAAVSIV